MKTFLLKLRLLKRCGNSSGVEHNLAKVGVASSNLVSRSIFFLLFFPIFLFSSDLALWPMYCVSNGKITLADLGFTDKSDEILNLGENKAAKINSRDLTEILKKRGVELEDKSGGETVFVKNCDALSLVQRAFLQEVTSEFKGLQFVKFPLIEPQNELPKNFHEYKFDKIYVNKINPKGSFRAGFVAPNGSQPSVFFRYEISAKMPVLRATKPIATRQMLGIGDFAKDWVELREFSPDMMSDAPNARLAAKQNIKSGEVLRLRQFTPLPLIKKGERVNAVLSDGTLSIIVEVTALENGNLGETIKVKNNDKKVFSAQIVSKKQVMIR